MEKNAEWNADFAGHPAAHCCAYTSARDLATLGDWVMKQYNDQGADAAAAWVRASMTDTVDATWSCEFQGTKRSFRFGYQWWVPSADAHDGFTAIGTRRAVPAHLPGAGRRHRTALRKARDRRRHLRSDAGPPADRRSGRRRVKASASPDMLTIDPFSQATLAGTAFPAFGDARSECQRSSNGPCD